jgi:hypothetical protein
VAGDGGVVDAFDGHERQRVLGAVSDHV